MGNIKFKYDQVFKVLERLQVDSSLRENAEAQGWITSFRNALERHVHRKPEDHRLAAQMAVDSAKTLVQIAIAVFVATGGFIQFAFGAGFGWNSVPVILLALAGVATFASMCFGFVAIGKAFKRGEGKEDAKEQPWATTAIASNLHAQSYLGVGALILFAAAMVAWNLPDAGPRQAVTIRFAELTAEFKSDEAITFEGHWSDLRIRQGQKSFALQIGSDTPSKPQSFSVEIGKASR